MSTTNVPQGIHLMPAERKLVDAIDVYLQTSTEENDAVSTALGMTLDSFHARRANIRRKLGIVIKGNNGWRRARESREATAAKFSPSRKGRLSHLGDARTEDVARCHCGLMLPCHHDELSGWDRRAG